MIPTFEEFKAKKGVVLEPTAAPTPEVVDCEGTIVGCFLESKLTDADIQRLLAYEKRMPTAPSELVKAVEEAIEALEWYHEERIASNLRAELDKVK